MTGETLIRHLERHAPADGKEARDREAVVAFLGRGGDPFDRRRFDPGHLTGSAFVLSSDGLRLLLVHHARLDLWIQPGGHGEPGETDPLEVALREAREETGIAGLAPHPTAPRPFDLDVHRIPPRSRPDPSESEPEHLHLDLRYLLVAPPGALPVASAESKAVEWVPLDAAIGGKADPGLARAVAKIRALVA